jgi:two-component system response regulator YesN
MKKLMVVDDEFIVRVGIRSIADWENYGYTMAADASNGEEALEKIARCRPDIVLTDLKMENMDGFELIRRCAVEFPEIQFIVLSSHNDFEDVRKAMKLGAKDYLFKPTLDRDELLRVLGEVSARREAPDPAAAGTAALDTVIRENLQAIRFNLLRKWVNQSNNIDNIDDILSQYHTLAPKTDLYKPFVILYLSIDDFEKQYLHGDTQFLKSSMENTIYQILNQEKAEVFNYEKGDMAVFINISGDGVNQSGLEELFLKIREYLRRYTGLDVSGVISPEAGIGKVPEIIRNCENTLALRTGRAALLPYSHGQRNEIARAREFIIRHIGERLGVGDIAAAAGMSESYFSRLFKKETGLNVVDYITRRKMERAAELLGNPVTKVADVAGQIGIDNPNYFSVIFKRVMGLSPQEYREKIKSGSRGQLLMP